MTITQVAEEALAFVEDLDAPGRAHMLAIVAMDKDQVRRLLEDARATGRADAIQFMQVAWFLHAVVAALRQLDDGR